MTGHWSDKLNDLGACCDAVAWARNQPSAAAAWKNCQCGDWMLWLAGRLSGEPGSDARKKLVLAACDRAELSAHLADNDGQMAIAWCLTIAREWAAGGDSDLEDIRHAASAASAASDAASDAASSVAAAAYARAKTLADCADIVRRYYPQAPELGGGQ